MLFWLFVIIFVVGVGLIVTGKIDWDSDKHEFLWENDTDIKRAGWIVSFISGLVLAIMMIILIGQYSTIGAYLEKSRETYNALTYKVESGACRDDFGLLSKEVIDEIQDWNTDIAYYKNIQDSFWLGIFYPNVYDEFEKIDYEKYIR